MTRICKTDQIQDAWAAGDRIGALRLAAQFFDRSAATKTFQRGMDANNQPGFYRQLGKEPQEVVTAAFAWQQREWGDLFSFADQPRVMSALPPKADIRCRDWHVCFVPKADIDHSIQSLS
jgi:hypothetical protein